jgi:signal peptidase II
LVVLVFDQLTKIWAVDRLRGGDVIDLFWTARFNLVYNEGAAFSVGSQFTIFISIAAIVISVGVIAFSRRVHEPRVLVAMGLVLGGALGNLIDRIVRDGNGFLRGAVVDFIDFQWWPVFNIADIAIVCGGILLVFLVSDRSEKAKTAASESVQSNPGADSVGTVGADPTDTSL